MRYSWEITDLLEHTKKNHVGPTRGILKQHRVFIITSEKIDAGP